MNFKQDDILLTFTANVPELRTSSERSQTQSMSVPGRTSSENKEAAILLRSLKNDTQSKIKRKISRILIEKCDILDLFEVCF